MTKKERRALAAYVRETMDILGLPQWKLILHRDYPGDGAQGQAQGYCDPTYGQHSAVMWFDPAITHELSTRQRYVVVHEVVHIFLHAPWQAFAQPLAGDGLVTDAVYGAITENARVAWELAVDQLARAIAPTLPFIDWTAKPDPEWIPKADADVLHIWSRMWRECGHHTPC